MAKGQAWESINTNIFDPDTNYDFYDALYEKMADSDMIGYDSEDKEQILVSAAMLLMVGLRKDSPRYTGNLQNRGIIGNRVSKYKTTITINAPGQINYEGVRLPDYGWQTDMLDRLQFYTVDGIYIDTPNKHKDWVERSVRNSLELFLQKQNSVNSTRLTNGGEEE